MDTTAQPASGPTRTIDAGAPNGLATDEVTVHLTLGVPERLCHDIFVTALEGGIGFWSAATSYRWARPDCDPADADAEDLTGFRATVVLQDDTWPDGADGSEPRSIDYSVVLAGVRRILAGEVTVNADLRSVLLLAVIADDSGDLDAGDADAIVQAGLLGDVVYG